MECNKVKLVMDSKSQNESLARTMVAAFITPLDPDMNTLSDVKTAVSEAVTNAIIHGYKNGSGEIELSMEINNGTLHISITDHGAGIADIEQAMKPLYTTSNPEMERAGMGFTVMESFMDKVRVSSTKGQGTVVEMTRDLNPDG